jgi:hypothetical protein
MNDVIRRLHQQLPHGLPGRVVGVIVIYRQLAKHSGKISGIAMKLIPAGATIEELEKKAADCERKAKRETEPEATKLREEALLCREWIAALRSGKWHA